LIFFFGSKNLPRRGPFQVVEEGFKFTVTFLRFPKSVVQSNVPWTLRPLSLLFRLSFYAFPFHVCCCGCVYPPSTMGRSGNSVHGLLITHHDAGWRDLTNTKKMTRWSSKFTPQSISALSIRIYNLIGPRWRGEKEAYKGKRKRNTAVGAHSWRPYIPPPSSYGQTKLLVRVPHRRPELSAYLASSSSLLGKFYARYTLLSLQQLRCYGCCVCLVKYLTDANQRLVSQQTRRKMVRRIRVRMSVLLLAALVKKKKGE
jgi:hypothetical protein